MIIVSKQKIIAEYREMISRMCHDAAIAYVAYRLGVDPRHVKLVISEIQEAA